MTADKRKRKLAIFWLGPLLVGSCIATGYEATHRLILHTSNLHGKKIELFQNENLHSGKELAALRQVHSNKQKTKMHEEDKTLVSVLVELQETEMQMMLNALETSLDNSEIATPNNKENFEELFQTLSTP